MRSDGNKSLAVRRGFPSDSGRTPGAGKPPGRPRARLGRDLIDKPRPPPIDVRAGRRDGPEYVRTERLIEDKTFVSIETAVIERKLTRNRGK